MTALEIFGVIFFLSLAITPFVFLELFNYLDKKADKEDKESKKNDGSRIKSRFPKN